jgi:hypothetical protein
MKKVINGRIYDPETAEMICQHTFGSPGDASYVKEALYRSPAGAFFIDGEGGAGSNYRVHVGTSWHIAGSDTLLQTGDTAREFVERFGTFSDYVRAFGHPEAG